MATATITRSRAYHQGGFVKHGGAWHVVLACSVRHGIETRATATVRPATPEECVTADAIIARQQAAQAALAATHRDD